MDLPSAPYLRWQLQYRLRDYGLDLPYASLNLNSKQWHIWQADPWSNKGRFTSRVINYIDTPFNISNESYLVETYYEAMRK